MADVKFTKNQDGSYDVTVSKNVPQEEKFVVGSLDELVNKVRELEAAEQPQQ